MQRCGNVRDLLQPDSMTASIGRDPDSDNLTASFPAEPVDTSWKADDTVTNLARHGGSRVRRQEPGVGEHNSGATTREDRGQFARS
jgi:hypothetical protein